MIAKVYRGQADAVAVRRMVRQVMDMTGAYLSDPEVCHDLELALCEAAANVARHAYPDTAGEIEIRVTLHPGSQVGFDIVDWGRGFDKDVCFDNADPHSECGRGMFLISQLTDSCQISKNGRENIVSLRKNIGKTSWKS